MMYDTDAHQPNKELVIALYVVLGQLPIEDSSAPDKDKAQLLPIFNMAH